MRNKKRTIATTPTVLLALSVMLLGGCIDANAAALETFVVDMLLNTAAALLL